MKNILKFKESVRIGTNGLLKKVIGTKYWEVQKPFVFYIEYGIDSIHTYNHFGKKIDNTIIVPCGFITDLASIPRIFWIFFDKSKYVSAILHDYIYSKKMYDRKTCDLILLKSMLVEGSSRLESVLWYVGVRLGGWVSYYFLKK